MYNPNNGFFEISNARVLSQPQGIDGVARLKDTLKIFSVAGYQFDTTDIAPAGSSSFKKMFQSQPIQDALHLPIDTYAEQRLFLNFFCEITTSANKLLFDVCLQFYDEDNVFISSSSVFPIINDDDTIDIQVIADGLIFPSNARYVFLGIQNKFTSDLTCTYKHAELKVILCEELLTPNIPKTVDTQKLFVLLGGVDGQIAPPAIPENLTVTSLIVNDKIDMNSNFITEVPDPTLDDHVSNKKYVDDSVNLKLDKSGGILSSDLDVNSNKLVNIANGTNATDCVNKGYIDNLFGTSSNGYTIFPIWAEESTRLNNGQYEWGFGDRDTTTKGVTIPVDCELFAISFATDSVSGTGAVINAQLDGVSVASITTSGASSYTIISSPVSVSAGNYLGFYTTSAGTLTETGIGSRVCAWFRKIASGQSGTNIGELLDVSTTSITDGQSLVYNSATSSFVPETLTTKTYVDDEIQSALDGGNSWTFDISNGNNNLVEIDYVRQGSQNNFNCVVRYSSVAEDGSPRLTMRQGVYSFQTFANSSGTTVQQPISYFGETGDDYIWVTYDTTTTPNKIQIYLKHTTDEIEDALGMCRIDVIGNTYTMSNPRISDLLVKNTVMPVVPDSALVVYKDDTTWVKKSGDTMSGVLNMNNQISMNSSRIINLSGPQGNFDAANKIYCDQNFVKVDGGNVSDSFTMSGSNISFASGGTIKNLPDPVSSQDGSNKNYVDLEANKRLRLTGGTLTGNLGLVSSSPTLTLQSTTGFAAIQARMNFNVHSAARGSGIFWNETSDTNRQAFFGRSYLTGGGIDSFVLAVTDSGEDLGTFSEATTAICATNNTYVGIRCRPTTDFDVRGDAKFRDTVEFQDAITIPAPTQDNHPATKKYVDDNSGGINTFFSIGQANAFCGTVLSLKANTAQYPLTGGKTYFCNFQVNFNSNEDIDSWGTCQVRCTYGNSNICSNTDGVAISQTFARQHCFSFTFRIIVPGSGTVNTNFSIFGAKVTRPARGNPAQNCNIEYTGTIIEV